MGYARRCPACGAYLDPGEVCDCQGEKEAAQDAANIQGGKGNKFTYTISVLGGNVK